MTRRGGGVGLISFLFIVTYLIDVLSKALDMLLEYSSTDVDGLISNLDLLLKWMTLRFFETNPSVNIKGWYLDLNHLRVCD